jgi:hypothetical protein
MFGDEHLDLADSSLMVHDGKKRRLVEVQGEKQVEERFAPARLPAGARVRVEPETRSGGPNTPRFQGPGCVET